MQLSGKSIIVTGASSGIGEAIATRFVAEGASVIVASRSEPSVEGAHFVATDVSDPGAVDALVAAAVARNGGLDVMVSNAGVQVEKTIAETTDDDFEFVMGVNVRGVFNCCRAAVRQMRDNRGGSIINVGSVAATLADHGLAVYNASKGAVQALTRAIAIDHGHEDIRCNSIAPGWIATALVDAVFDLSDDPEVARRAAVSRHPVGRLGRPDDVANMAVWLASDESIFASGSVFTVDGGLTAQSPIAP